MAMISSFYVLAMTLAIIFIPVWGSGAMFQLVTMIIPGLIILGVTGANVKKSTLYMNISTSGVKRRAFYVAQLITTIVVVNVLSIILWSLVWFLGHFAIFLDNFYVGQAYYMKTNPLIYGTPFFICYITMLTSLTVFATYFLIESITKSEKAYNLIVTSLFILGIIFGGSLNTYFVVPHDYYFYNFPLSNGKAGQDYVQLVHGGDFYVTEEFYLATNGLQDFYQHENATGISSYKNLFPDSMFIPTLFYPFYGVGEFASCAVTKHMNQDLLWNLNVNIIVVTDFVSYTPIETYGVIAKTTNEHFSMWSWFSMGFKDGAWMWTAVLLQPYITIITYFFLGKTIQLAKDK